ncbi:MAG: phosphatidate cytidylyltransferase [Salinibacter sp.]
MSNNLRRIGTAVLAAPVVVGAAYLGGWWFAGLVGLIGVLGQRELYLMAHEAGAHPYRGGGYLIGLSVVAIAVQPSLWSTGAILLLLFTVAAPLVLPHEQFLVSFAVTLAGMVYPTALLGSLVVLREVRGPAVADGEAFSLVLVVLLIVWATDVAAYYVGRTWGQRPLAPTISPSKTWGGTLGGIGAAVAAGILLKVAVVDVLAWPHVLALIAIGGGVGQVGDLLESTLKRSVGVDDSSTILPGHGGMLDRFDAMAVAAPIIVLYLHLVAGLF